MAKVSDADGNVLLDIPTRTFNFAVRIIKFCQRLNRVPDVGPTLCSQLLRAGTGVGSNVEEGQAAESRADFVSKYAISLKEARESNYRLRLLIAANVINDPELHPLQAEAEGLTRILGRSIVTAKRTGEAERAAKRRPR
jgi:four helix bundle protein